MCIHCLGHFSPLPPSPTLSPNLIFWSSKNSHFPFSSSQFGTRDKPQAVEYLCRPWVQTPLPQKKKILSFYIMHLKNSKDVLSCHCFYYYNLFLFPTSAGSFLNPSIWECEESFPLSLAHLACLPMGSSRSLCLRILHASQLSWVHC
jgi:hypothetical protein